VRPVIAQSIRDLDYIVKEKLFLERLLDMEFQEPITGAFFYNGTSFNCCLRLSASVVCE